MFSIRHNIIDESPETFNRFSIAFLFVLSALLMLRQLVSPNYFTVIVEDAFIYPSWAWQFIEALKEGTIYPRWLPLDFWGYGSPTFILYPPLAFYMTAIFNLLTGSIIPAMNLVKFTALFLSGTGIYFLVKEFYPARVALLSAMFYVILPFNIFSMYLYGSFAAMVSCMWFAPILLFIHKYCKTGHRKYLVYSGACYGGLILTHLITAYMFTFVIVAFAVCMAVSGKRARDIVIIPAVLLTGLSLSAAYILPVIFEKKFVNLENFTSDTNYIYSNFFILPDMTARIAKWRFWPIYYNTMALHVALFSLLILICLIRSSKSGNTADSGVTNTVNTFFLSTATCSVLLLFGVSSFIWETVPFFKYIIFPTRWLHITAFAAAFLSASVFVSIWKDNRSNMNNIVLPALLFLSCIALDFSFITGALSYSKKEPPPAIAVNWVFEHLPKGVRIDKLDGKFTGSENKITIQDGGSGEVVSWKSAKRIVDVKAVKPVVVRFATFSFPGWTARLDGAQTEISPEMDTRAITVNVPKGNHRLELVFKDTPVRCCGKLISLVSVVLLTTFLAKTQLLKLKDGLES